MTAACPGCVALPELPELTERTTPDPIKGNIILALPGIHCAACIAQVERALSGTPGVRSARVNLSARNVRIDAPGVEPAALIDVLAAVGHPAQELDAEMMAAAETDPAGRALLTRIAVAGFAMMNVMLFSVAVWSGASAATQTLFHWISAAIAVPALLYAAQVFFSMAWNALRVGRLNMDVPISLAIILACGMSVYETIQGHADVYFDAALSLTFFLLVGRYLDHRTRVAARSAARELSALEVQRAERLEDGMPRSVALADLRVGDRLRVSRGMRIPVDGRILDGQSEMDRSLLTGESEACPVGPGAIVAAGEVNLGAPLTLEATAVGEDTTLRRMAAMVEVAERARNRYTALADRAAAIYAPAVHLLALVAFASWWTLSGDVARALNVAISVLIITCPCALGLAVPAVMTAASGRLFRNGLLVKDATALERLAEVDSVIFDKTGTLTEGRAALTDAQIGANGLAIVAGLTAHSEHPVARALRRSLPEGATPAPLDDLKELPGCGMTATWQGQPVRLGRADWVGGGALTSPALRIGTAPAVPLDVRETLREGAWETAQTLQARGMDMQILSGDSADRTRRVADALGIAEFAATQTPEQKQDHITRRTQAGQRVLMVGDGLNDTGALALAHASISPASALDASRTASDIVVLGKSLAAIPLAIATARSARARVIENFAIAAGYNMIAIPIALAGYATPLAAAIAMSLSSITVLLNALRLR